jgi:hypothetical protein
MRQMGLAGAIRDRRGETTVLLFRCILARIAGLRPPVVARC